MFESLNKKIAETIHQKQKHFPDVSTTSISNIRYDLLTRKNYTIYFTKQKRMHICLRVSNIVENLKHCLTSSTIQTPTFGYDGRLVGRIN